jgi:hypothetical protein
MGAERKRDERIAELEARPVGLNYQGVWTPGASYAKDMGVTHRGSIWVATRALPHADPAAPNSGFRLAVKAGGDGKDARK